MANPPAAQMSWIDAIRTVLRDAGRAMHYTDIADEIVSRKLRRTLGATPAATVSGTICTHIKHKRSGTPLLRVGPGEYMLQGGVTPTPGRSTATTGIEADADEITPGVVHAFGMSWRRDRVYWKSAPRVFGSQGSSAQVVDFADQRGVYLLYDGRQAVYVGRSVDRSLGQRLYEHTFDRLNGRWDRFSWFGVRRVTPDGELVDASNAGLSDAALIAVMEALLIEALEPPQNRRRGDDFQAVEYLQADDPALKARQLEQTLDALRTKLQS